MAISNYKARLMHKPESGEWTMLCPIKGTPSIGGTPNRLETTTNEDDTQTFIAGIKQVSETTVKANYEPEDYDKLSALEHVQGDYAVWFGNEGDGSKGKFSCKGEISVTIDESEVDGVLEMSIGIMNSTPWVKDATAAG